MTFGSVAVRRGSKHHEHYAGTKAVLIAFGRSLAWEVGKGGIHVKAAAPSIIATNTTADLVTKTGMNLLELENALLRRNGEAAEAAQAITFLTSDATLCITDATLDVSRGRHMS